ncbi:MAG: hypothetical protein OXG96_04245, partial [Acidobacteria bacterium]|nr:hypothetical protein [Acidobacteriota bacterium]
MPFSNSSGRNPEAETGTLTRRGFFAGVGAALLLNGWKPVWAAKKEAESRHGSIRVTDIEVHNITEEFVD